MKQDNNPKDEEKRMITIFCPGMTCPSREYKHHEAKCKYCGCDALRLEDHPIIAVDPKPIIAEIKVA